MRHTFLRHLTLLSALPLLACGGDSGTEATGPDGLLHLDPRIADGRVTADLLAARSEVVQSFELRSAETLEEDLAGWQVRNARHGDALSGDGGVVFQSREYDPAAGKTHATLRHVVPFHARDFNLIELDLRFPGQASSGSASAAVIWRPVELPADFQQAGLRISVPLERTREVQTVRFPVGSSMDWTGELRWLELFPVASGPQTFEVHAVRFLSEGFGLGATPLARAGEAGAASGGGADGGLVGSGGDLRRVWPADAGHPLACTLDVPDGARLLVQATPSGYLAGSEEELVLAVEARVEGAGGEFQRLVEERRELSGDGALQPGMLRADLASFAGQRIELRLRAGLGGLPEGEPTTPEPSRALLAWSTPVVLGEPPADPRPNVVLITLDTLRSDVLGTYGGPVAAPALDRLGKDGLVFEEAWTGCNSTLPSHTSILTGLPVPTHGVLDNRSTLDPAVRTLTQVLRGAGYWCAGAVSVEHLRASFSGLGRGFDQYSDCPPRSSFDGSITVERVLGWAEDWGDVELRPIFLWVHLFDPHTPYGPPADFLASYEARPDVVVPPRTAEPESIGQTALKLPGGFLAGVTNAEYAEHLYRAGVAYTDHLLGQLLDGLAAVGMDTSNTIFVLTADHGEALGEGDVWYNHATLIEPIVRVPLVIAAPGLARGARIEGRVSTVDVAGSVLDYLGLEPLGDGPRLLRNPQALDPAQRAWFVHSNLDQTGFREDGLHYFENGKRRFMHLGEERASQPGTRFLYDPEADPEFATNLAGERPESADRYSREVREWSAEQKRGRVIRNDLSEEERATLEGLGYLISEDEDSPD